MHHFVFMHLFVVKECGECDPISSVQKKSMAKANIYNIEFI